MISRQHQSLVYRTRRAGRTSLNCLGFHRVQLFRLQQPAHCTLENLDSTAEQRILHVHPHRKGRGGLTLLEILLSLAIFFGALAVLSQLAWNGIRAGVQSRLKTQAIIRCEAKLAEVLSGAEPLQPKTRVAFPDNSAWNYSVTISETPTYPDLLQLDVMVSHVGNSRLASCEFTLRRWMRDPALFQDAAMKKKESATQ